jgi:hypothetical protein
MEQLDVFTHCRKIGLMVRAGWEAKAKVLLPAAWDTLSLT